MSAGRFLIGFSLLATVVSCGSNTDQPIPENSLAVLIRELDLPVQRDSLIACAASGQHGFLAELSGLPVSVIYLPVPDATEVWFFESEGPLADKTDLTKYQQRDLARAPLFNGFLQKFVHAGGANESIGIVAALSRGKLFLSNEITIKGDQPTLFSEERIDIDLSDPLMPAFSWPASMVGEDAIYFHVVSDAANNLISGTYTIDPQFQFYDLSNVVLNIHDTDPQPALQPNEDYTISVLAVSIDNWVNFFGSQDFRTGN